MKTDFSQLAFLAGEMSPAFQARVDLSKYDLGLSLCNNFLIDYRGGAKTRGGMLFQDFTPENAFLFEFQLGGDNSSILIVATHQKFRFMQEGKYLLDAQIPVASFAGSTITTSSAHGLTVGSYVVVNDGSLSYTYEVVGVPTSTTLQLKYPNGETATLSAVSWLAPVQEVVTPYGRGELRRVRMSQDYLTIRIFHHSHNVKELTYDLTTLSWSFTSLLTGATIFPPVGLTATASATGTAQVVFVVTAVNSNGEESIASPPIRLSGIVNYTTTAGHVAIRWEPQADAQFYRVYRSIVTDSSDLSLWSTVGLIGETTTACLVDTNITPDYTKTPPLRNNPFSDGAVLSVQVTNQGSSYVSGKTMVSRDSNGTGLFASMTVDVSGTVTAVTVLYGGQNYVSPWLYIYADNGMGFVGKATVVAGVITAITVVKGGINYPQGTCVVRNASHPEMLLHPVVVSGKITEVMVISGGGGITTALPLTINGSAGSGAAASIYVVSPPNGNNPSVGIKFQQRQLYAGTDSLPNSIFGSKPGAPRNFDYSRVPAPDDSFIFSLDNESISPIKHLVRQLDGLLVFHKNGIERIKAQSGTAITPTDKVSEPQSWSGVSDVPPLRIDSDLLYTTANGAGVQTLNYTLYSNSFSSVNLSVLCPHLFGERQNPVSWVWNESPNRLVWLVREDGRFLSLTYMKDQEIFAWARHETYGKVIDICTTTENDKKVIYVSTERNSGFFIERFVQDPFLNVEEYLGLDAAATFVPTAYTNSLTIVESEDGTALISGTTHGSLGAVIRAAGGIYRIDRFQSGKAVCTILAGAKLFSPGTTLPLVEGFTVGQPTTSVKNLWHLEGETISALVDGDVVEGLLVENGEVTLPNPGTYIHVGIPYTAKIETLPLYSAQQQTNGMIKRIVSGQIVVEQTRGLSLGVKGQPLYEVKDMTMELLDGPLSETPSPTQVHVASQWNLNQQLVFEQIYPLPATILAYLAESEFGI